MGKRPPEGTKARWCWEFELELNDEDIDPIVSDMYEAINDENTKYHADHFTYTESKRILERLRHQLTVLQ
jgi:hypothetical protein